MDVSLGGENGDRDVMAEDIDMAAEGCFLKRGDFIFSGYLEQVKRSVLGSRKQVNTKQGCFERMMNEEETNIER